MDRRFGNFLLRPIISFSHQCSPHSGISLVNSKTDHGLYRVDEAASRMWKVIPSFRVNARDGSAGQRRSLLHRRMCRAGRVAIFMLGKDAAFEWLLLRASADSMPRAMTWPLRSEICDDPT